MWPYVLSQVVGALAASLLLKLIFPAHGDLGATLPAVTPWKAFAVEVALSFFLMFAIIHVAARAKERGLMAGVAVGGFVCLAAIFAGPLTRASMKPARLLAPALAYGLLDSVWICQTAPFIGAALAIAPCRLMRTGDCCTVIDAAVSGCADEVS